MGEILKVLGQGTPTAATLTDMYTVPSSFSAVISSIVICNHNSFTSLFRVSVAKAGASDTVSQYLYYDLPLLANDTFIATIGISLAMDDVIRVRSDVSNVSFNILGLEVGSFGPPPANLAGGDLDGYYPNPTVVALQTNPVYPDILGAGQDGYALRWDNTDGYWHAAVISSNIIDGVTVSGTPTSGQVITATSSTTADWQTPTGGGGAVIFDGGSPAANARTDRSTDQSAIDNTKQGIVNLSSDTSTVSPGATGNFSTISGGDQNIIGADYGTIGGGLSNQVSSNTGTIGGGESNLVNGDHGTVVGGISCTAGEQAVAGGNTNSATGSFSVAFGFDNTASGLGATALGGGVQANGEASLAYGFQSLTNKLAQVSLSSAGGNINNAPGDCQNGNVVYGNKHRSTTIAVASNGASLPQSTINVLSTTGFPASGTINVVSGAGTQTVTYTGKTFNTFTGCSGGTGLLSTGNAVDNIGHVFNVIDFQENELVLDTAKYYNLQINIVIMANNAAVGPAFWSYNVLIHLAGGLIVIDNQQQTITTPDPNSTGWLTSITSDATLPIVHININPNTDTTNILNASADIKWVEVAGFSQ